MDEYIDVAGFTHFPKNERRSKNKALTLENVINYPGYFWDKLINYNIALKIVAIVCVSSLLLGIIFGYSISHSAYVKELEARDAAEIEAAILAAKEEEEKATEGQRITMQRALTENLARVLQGVDKYNLSDNAKLAYLQILSNRANPDIQYDVMKGTNTLDEVLHVPGQFEGFTYGEGYYSKDNYAIAEAFINSTQNYLNSDRYYWAEIHNGYLIAKADFNGSGDQQRVG